jgi:hypothetical protein
MKMSNLGARLRALSERARRSAYSDRAIAGVGRSMLVSDWRAIEGIAAALERSGPSNDALQLRTTIFSRSLRDELADVILEESQARQSEKSAQSLQND